MRDLTFVDCETTGLDPATHEVIEVGAVRLEPTTCRVVATLHEYVTPKCPVAPEAAAVNGYDEARWRERGAKPFHDIASSITEILSGAQLAGQNVPFDKDFLGVEYARCRVPFPKLDYHTVDLMSLAHPLVVAGLIPGVGLRHQMRLFGLGEQRHTALDDVLAEVEVYKTIVSVVTQVFRKMYTPGPGMVLCTACGPERFTVERWPFRSGCTICGGVGAVAAPKGHDSSSSAPPSTPRPDTTRRLRRGPA